MLWAQPPVICLAGELPIAAATSRFSLLEPSEMPSTEALDYRS